MKRSRRDSNPPYHLDRVACLPLTLRVHIVDILLDERSGVNSTGDGDRTRKLWLERPATFSNLSTPTCAPVVTIHPASVLQTDANPSQLETHVEGSFSVAPTTISSSFYCKTERTGKPVLMRRLTASHASESHAGFEPTTTPWQGVMLPLH